jgi:Protein of unknown function DUF45
MFCQVASISIDGDLHGNINNSNVFVLLSIGIEDIITKHKIRDWQHHQDIQNRMIDEIDDLVRDLKKTHNLSISWEDLSELVPKIFNIAKTYEVMRFPNHSTSFYRLLTRMMPDWIDRKNRLNSQVELRANY